MNRLEELVKEMFMILDRIEMSDEGREFHPTTISSYRAVDGHKLGSILIDMRDLLELPPPAKLRTRSEIEPDICPRCNGTGDTANHERDSWDCSLCKTSGRVKPCPVCEGTGYNDDDIYNQGKDCTACDGIGLVANKNW